MANHIHRRHRTHKNPSPAAHGTNREAHVARLAAWNLNSPYAYPGRHRERDADGQPTNKLIESRRRSDLVTPVPKAKKHKAPKGPTAQLELDLTADDEGLRG